MELILTPDFGAQITLKFNNRFLTLRDGDTDAIVGWRNPLIEIDFSNAWFDKPVGDYLRRFADIVNGQDRAFSYLDPSDYLATEEHDDTGLGIVTYGCLWPVPDGVKTQFQLYKCYHLSGSDTNRVLRPITRPDYREVRIFRDGIEVVAEVFSNGKVVFEDPPTSGVLRWRGTFKVPVRFEGEQNIGFEVLNEDGDDTLYSLPNLKLIEVRESLPELNGTIDVPDPTINPDELKEHSFAIDLTVGSITYPQHRTIINKTDSGFEKRRSLSDNPFFTVEMGKGFINRAETEYLIGLWRLSCGAFPIKYRDYSRQVFPYPNEFSPPSTLDYVVRPASELSLQVDFDSEDTITENRPGMLYEVTVRMTVTWRDIATKGKLRKVVRTGETTNTLSFIPRFGIPRPEWIGVPNGFSFWGFQWAKASDGLTIADVGITNPSNDGTPPDNIIDIEGDFSLSRGIPCEAQLTYVEILSVTPITNAPLAVITRKGEKSLIPSIKFRQVGENSEFMPYCCAWKIARLDGEIIGATDHDTDFSFNGVSYEARSGFTATAQEKNFKLEPNETELTSIINTDAITELDIFKGAYANAEVEIFIYDWLNRAKITSLFTGILGELTMAIDSEGIQTFTYKAMSQHLKLTAKRSVLTTKLCRHEFGDSGCKKDLSGLTDILSVGDSETTTSFRPSTWPDRPFGFYDNGKLIFTSGDLEGVTADIRTKDGFNRFYLFAPLPLVPKLGDTFIAVGGCAKTLEACKAFNNSINFGGQPYVPGSDRLVEGAGT